VIHHAHKNRVGPGGGMFFGPRDETDVERRIAELIDNALEAENVAQTPRSYLGGSRLGVECLRQLAFEWFAQQDLRRLYDSGQWPPAMQTSKFPGRVIRRFLLGHLHEAETARWMRLAGFDLRTEKADGGQFAFSILGEKIGGHFDGVVIGGPLAICYPLLWEHKIMNAKSWGKTRDKGVQEAHPVYYYQLQSYMAYSPKAVGEQLEGALFQALNTDTSELISELVPFRPEDAQWASDRGVAVVTSRSPEEHPRITSDPNFWRCKFCDHRDQCWSESNNTVQERPSWLG